jgi:hypothetical protein
MEKYKSLKSIISKLNTLFENMSVEEKYGCKCIKCNVFKYESDFPKYNGKKYGNICNDCQIKIQAKSSLFASIHLDVANHALLSKNRRYYDLVSDVYDCDNCRFFNEKGIIYKNELVQCISLKKVRNCRKREQYYIDNNPIEKYENEIKKQINDQLTDDVILLKAMLIKLNRKLTNLKNEKK